VKFLIDNQLPAALALYLKKRGFDCHRSRAGRLVDVQLPHGERVDRLGRSLRDLITMLDDLKPRREIRAQAETDSAV
jgi:hypothetical protein